MRTLYGNLSPLVLTARDGPVTIRDALITATEGDHGIYAEGVSDLVIGPNVRLYSGGWDCNIHLVGCKRVRILDVGMFEVNTRMYNGDQHGKGLLLDNCKQIDVRGYLVRTTTEMGDGVNVFNSTDVSLRDGVVIGPRRNIPGVDIGAGVVIDKGSKRCLVAGLNVNDLGPDIAAVTVLGSGHVIKDVHGGVVQLGLDGQSDSVRDVRVLRCQQVWTTPGAKRVSIR